MLFTFQLTTGDHIRTVIILKLIPRMYKIHCLDITLAIPNVKLLENSSFQHLVVEHSRLACCKSTYVMCEMVSIVHHEEKSVHVGGRA